MDATGPSPLLQPPHQRRRRLVGATTLVLLTALVALAQWFSGARQRDHSLQQGWLALARLGDATPAERGPLMAQAQAHFSRAAAIVSLEPMAMIGVAVSDRMVEVWGSPLALPPPPTQCSDDEAASWLRTALERGQPAAALAWASHPAILRRRGSLGALLRFAEGWQLVVAGQKATTRQSPGGH